MVLETRSDYSLTRLGFTQIISDAFDLSVYNYVAIFLVSIPVLIINFVFFSAEYSSLVEGLNRFWANPAILRHALDSDRLYWANVIAATWSFVASCGIARLFHDRLGKQSASATTSMVAGAKRSLQAVVVAALAGIAALVVTMVFIVAVDLVDGIAFIAIIALFGTVAFVFVFYALAFAACVVDGVGPLAAFQVARSLTRGHRWGLLGLSVFACLFQGMFFAVLGLSTLAIVTATSWAFPTEFVGFLTTTLGGVLVVLGGVLATGWNNGLMIVTYNRLKALKGCATP